MRWNYLRVRGEYKLLAEQDEAVKELPPRARRIPASATATTAVRGTTSACAENTLNCFEEAVMQRNYLRVRGEYLQERMEDAQILELPPRARRIRLSAPIFPTKHGTTSACAENTNIMHTPIAKPRNYLRVRGEYKTKPARPQPTPELPPRARRIP